MKASLTAARSVQAAESVAENVTALKAQLDRIETMFNQLLESLAHNDVIDTEKEVGITPKRGRPTSARS